ncbi:MAG: hypothetical protein NTX05_00780 [Fusobacteria bacterium]|nr:hypothetical protein [Fusobacteriota bacterium]
MRKNLFFKEFDKSKIIDPFILNFSTVGCYEKIIIHILEHRFYMDESLKENSSLEIATQSWYQNLFLLIIEAVQESDILANIHDKT